MTRILRCGSLIGGLMLGLACGTEPPTAPSAVPAPPAITQPPQRLPSGQLVVTYVFSGQLEGFPVSGFTPGSQYLLYDSGEFGLRYDGIAHVYLGTYRQDNATITFRFAAEWTWDQGWSCLSDSRLTGADARSRRGPSTGTCWRSATATAWCTRTSRTPSTGDPSRRRSSSFRARNPKYLQRSQRQATHVAGRASASRWRVVPGSGQRGATAANILAAEPKWRLAIVALLVMLACDVAVATLFYVLFVQVSRAVALLGFAFRLVQTSLQAVAVLARLVPVLFLATLAVRSDRAGAASRARCGARA